MRYLTIAAFFYVGVLGNICFAKMPNNATALLYTAPITHIGSAPKVNETLKEGGAGPFLVMFNRVLPTGWAVWQGAITEPLPHSVQWGATKPWFDVIGDVLILNNLRADLDWTNRTLVLHTQRLASNASPPASTTSAPTSRVGSPPPPAPKAEITSWAIMPSDGTLKNAMTRWSREAGWTLLYEASNFSFESFAEFEGEFKPAVCRVLANINASIAENKKSAPLNAGFWPGNKTIRIFDVRSDSLINAPESCEVLAPPKAKAVNNKTIEEVATPPGVKLVRVSL